MDEMEPFSFNVKNTTTNRFLFYFISCYQNDRGKPASSFFFKMTSMRKKTCGSSKQMIVISHFWKEREGELKLNALFVSKP